MRGKVCLAHEGPDVQTCGHVRSWCLTTVGASGDHHQAQLEPLELEKKSYEHRVSNFNGNSPQRGDTVPSQLISFHHFSQCFNLLRISLRQAHLDELKRAPISSASLLISVESDPQRSIMENAFLKS